MPKLKSRFTMVPDEIINSTLSYSVLKVILYLLSWQHKEKIYMGHAKIATDCNLCESTVKRALKSLEKLKYITIGSGKIDRRTNSYIINFDQIDSRCIMTKEEDELKEILLKRNTETKREKELKEIVRVQKEKNNENNINAYN